MSDNFEKFVKQHREEFDLFEPQPALWNTIQSKVDQKKKHSLFPLLSKAAAVAIIFILSFWAQKQMEQKPQSLKPYAVHQSKSSEPLAIPKNETPVIARQVNQTVSEMVETEKYYSRKIDNTVKEMKVYLIKYPEVAHDMKKDLAELDSIYRLLKKDLGDNAANEEIINAMIQNYRMKLQILEDIKNELIQNNSSKSSSKSNSHEI